MTRGLQRSADPASVEPSTNRAAGCCRRPASAGLVLVVAAAAAVVTAPRSVAGQDGVGGLRFVTHTIDGDGRDEYRHR